MPGTSSAGRLAAVGRQSKSAERAERAGTLGSPGSVKAAGKC